MDKKKAALTPEAAEWVENELNPIVPELVNALCVLKDHLYTEPMTPVLRNAGVHSNSNSTKVIIATPVVKGHWLVCHDDKIVLHHADRTWNIILPLFFIKGREAVLVEDNARNIEGKLLGVLQTLTGMLAGQLKAIDGELSAIRAQEC